MKTPYQLKQDFLSYVVSLREEAQKELDLFSSGTVIMHRNGDDITAEAVDRLKAMIARHDDLMAKLQREMNAQRPQRP